MKQRHSIFVKGTIGQLVPNTYNPDKRSICWLHLTIAHRLKKIGLSAINESELLDLVDEAFDCGKRMDAALDEYRQHDSD